MRRYEQVVSYIMLILLMISLLPVMYLGRYNHPTGDDYDYGDQTRRTWEQTGSLMETAAEAVEGTIYQYHHWQGTYSAMFLMHLPPNIFHAQAYDFVTTVILCLLVGGIFYLGKPLICGVGRGSRALWILWCSLLSLLCVQTVPSQGETFFWYNGSMYYTGYFTVTLFFFGIVCRYLMNSKKYHLPLLLFLAAFLAGGNYVSLLPAILVVILLTVVLFWKKQKKEAVSMLIVAVVLLLGLAVSAIAPGNVMRQSDMWKIPAWKAVAKSLVAGVRFLYAWIGEGWWLVAVALLIPVWWKNYEKNEFRFRYPLIVTGLAYGIFCSMTCPTFYTMNSTGPARAVAIVYYGFHLVTLFCAYYWLGYIHRIYQKSVLREKLKGKLEKAPLKKTFFTAAVLVLLAVPVCQGKVSRLTTAKAIDSLFSGEAAAYEEEYRERLALLEDPDVQDVVIPPYKTQPDMLYVGDITEDPEHTGNQAMARYFGKNSVRLGET